MDLETKWRTKLNRQASLIERYEGRPDTNPFQSWFGRITLGLSGESWPEQKGRPMWPLCQIIVKNLPYVPPTIKDIALIRVYIDEDFNAYDTDYGEGWHIKANQTMDGLIELPEAEHNSSIKPYVARWRHVEHDYPTHDDLPLDMPEELRDQYYDMFDNVDGTKVGGWPSNVQSEITWAPWNRHPYNPEYVFQIDSDYKSHWAWGDSGVGYFGRGTGEHRDQWAMSWQCC